jgi:hypothetical protein
MKTINQIIIFLVLTVATHSKSQSLHVRGMILNYQEEQLSAHYALYRNDTLVQADCSDVMRLKLTLDQNYKLHIYRSGYQAKLIAFSTKAPVHKKFKFDFLITLHKLPGVKDELETKTAGMVYFDEKISLFSFRTY